MGRFRSRLRRLERETEVKARILVCPECSKEFVAHGDVALEFLAEEWPGAVEAKPTIRLARISCVSSTTSTIQRCLWTRRAVRLSWAGSLLAWSSGSTPMK
jgi:hypothetical protein